MNIARDFPDLLPTRRSLLSRLRDFFQTYWRLIYEVARKAGLGDAEAQEVVQETVISVAKQMPGFRYDPARGRFKGWLLQITRGRLQANGATGGQRVEMLSTEHIDSLPDPAGGDLEAIWDAEWERHVFNAAAENVKKHVNPEHYQLFDLYVIQKWPVKKISAMLRVSAGQVYLARHRVGALLKKEIARIAFETRKSSTAN